MLSRVRLNRVAGRSQPLRPGKASGISTRASLTANALRPSRSALSRPTTASLSALNLPAYTRNMSAHAESAVRPAPDQVVQDIADYVLNYQITSELAYETARLCLIDTIGCGLEGLRFPECAKLLGPVVEGTTVPNGASLHCFSLSDNADVVPLPAIKALEFPELTTSSTPSGARSTLGQ
jgi:hypothetical protein